MTKVAIDPRRAGRAVTIAAVALASLSGCELTPATSGSSSNSRATSSAASLIDARRDEFQIDHDAYASIGYRIDWRGFPVVARNERIEFLDLYDDIVIAHESAATVSVMEASTGALRNSSQVASRLERFVGNFRVGEQAYVASDNRAYVIGLETGSLNERHTLSRVVSTAPAQTGNQMIFGTSIGHVYSRHLSPPIDAWAFDLGSPIDADPVLVGGVLVAISRRGDIAFLDARSGTLLSRSSIYGGCEADPVGGEGMVFFASVDQSIYGYTLDGDQVWRIRTEQPLRQTPTYHAGVVYVPTDDMGLRAIDAVTGTALWAQSELDGRVVGLRNGELLVWNGSAASLVDPATGDVITSANLDGLSMLKLDRFVDGNLYAVSDGGIVAKFQPRD